MSMNLQTSVQKPGVLDKIFDWLTSVFSYLLLVSVLYVTFEVFSRYLFSKPHDYSEILAKYMVLMVVLGGAGIAYYRNVQIKMDLAVSKIRGRALMFIKMIEALFTFVACGILTLFTAKYCAFLFSIGSESETSIPIPHWIEPLALLIGVFFVSLVAFVRMGGFFRDFIKFHQ